MEKRSKTNWEIYTQEYPIEKLLKKPILCVEAIGYLKALAKFLPSEQKWIDSEIAMLNLIFDYYFFNMWEV